MTVPYTNNQLWGFEKVKACVLGLVQSVRIFQVFLSWRAPRRKYSSDENGPLPFTVKRINKISTTIVRTNSKLFCSMFLLFIKTRATITMGSWIMQEILVNKPTSIKKPHNNVRMVTSNAIAPELLENMPMPVCSTIDFKDAVSRINVMPFHSRISPKVIRKMLSKPGWVRPDLFVVTTCAIKIIYKY